jgi:hypothetical protein
MDAAAGVRAPFRPRVARVRRAFTLTDERVVMTGESMVWTLAAWLVENISDPELLVVLVAGCAALVGFRVSGRVAQIKARVATRPADDLI